MALRIEDVKRGGLFVDIDALAESGFESISEADRYRLKTQGICAQRQVGVFMLRIRIPGGKASAAQLRQVSSLAKRYGHGSLHVTTRGGLEIHHVKLADVQAVWKELAEVGLTTKGTCGDTIRNVIGCAHAGTYAGEVLPLPPFINLLHEHIVSISDQTNISRKINVAIACSPTCDDHLAANDIGFVASQSPNGGAPGFAVWGAGGLGATPRLSILLAEWLPQEDLLPAFSAVIALGEKHADRSNRAKAKIKMLVEKWGSEKLRQVFEEELALARARGLPAISVQPETAPPATAPAPRAGTVAEQKQAGSFTVPALIPMGELSCAGADALAAASERFGDGIVHLTPDQNAELQFVPADKVADAVAAIEALGLKTRGRGGIADVVSCVGLEYCALAIAGSMTMGEEIAQAMEGRRLDPRYSDFRVHVSGCPHSCAKHQLADVGLSGGNQEINGVRKEVFTLWLGGNASERRLGLTFAKKIERARVVPVIEAMLGVYEANALEGERFSATVARLGEKPFFSAAEHVLDGRRQDARGGRLVVVGNGMAGARFVEELRKHDREHRYEILMYGDEHGGNYNRIMLAGVLGGAREADAIVTHPLDWYAEQKVRLRAGVRVTSIDRHRRVVLDESGAEEPYDTLVLATGSRPLVPPIEGIDREGVFVFRTLADCRSIRERAAGVKHAIVLGGGLLGLEAASGLRALGVEVTVIHLASWLMEQQLDRDAGAALLPSIRALGIEVLTEARATAVVGDGEGIEGVRLADGRLVEGQLVIMCCGIVPNTALAKAAGLAVERGVVVDDALRTSDDRIYALGECVQHRGLTYGLVDPLWDQATVLAQRLGGNDSLYHGSRTGTRLKVAGIQVVALGERAPASGDEAIAARGSDGSYRSIILRDGKLVGAQVVGDQEAGAMLAQAFQRDAPLPGDLAWLIFGPRTPSVEPTLATSSEDRRVCLCNDVWQATIVDAIRSGARDVASIGRCTGAGTGCGSCRGELASLVIEHDAIHHQPAVASEQVTVREPTAPAPAPAPALALEEAIIEHLRGSFEAAARTPSAERSHSLSAYARKVRAAATLLENPEIISRTA